MKSPGVIYRQYRLLRHNHLKKELEKDLKRCPQNCRFWKDLSLKDENGKGYKVPLCYLGQEEGKPINPKLLAICSTVDNAQRCNAFISKNRQEDVERRLISDLNDPKVRFEKYPELATLEWVLDKELHEAKVSLKVPSRLVVSLISWLEWVLKYLNRTKRP